MSWPAIAASVLVVIWWGSQSLKALRKSYNTSSELFAIGVAVGFLGEILDSLYWCIPWTMSFTGSLNTATWMNNGVYFNIFFRQAFTIMAATLHLKSYIRFVEESGASGAKLEAVRQMFAIGAWVLGGIYVGVLTLLI